METGEPFSGNPRLAYLFHHLEVLQLSRQDSLGGPHQVDLVTVQQNLCCERNSSIGSFPVPIEFSTL